MKSILYILFLTSLVGFSQGKPKVDVLKFTGSVTSTVRDSYDVPVGEVWLIWNTTSEQFEQGDEDEVWTAFAGGGSADGAITDITLNGEILEITGTGTAENTNVDLSAFALDENFTAAQIRDSLQSLAGANRLNALFVKDSYLHQQDSDISGGVSINSYSNDGIKQVDPDMLDIPSGADSGSNFDFLQTIEDDGTGVMAQLYYDVENEKIFKRFRNGEFPTAFGSWAEIGASGGSSGLGNPATENLDMDSFDITGVDNISANTADLNSGKISNMADPTLPQDGATKAYVDANDTDDQTASEVSFTDSGEFFDATTVEAALLELTKIKDTTVTSIAFTPTPVQNGYIVEIDNANDVTINVPTGTHADGDTKTFQKINTGDVIFDFPNWIDGQYYQITDLGKSVNIRYKTTARNGSNWAFLGGAVPYTVVSNVYTLPTPLSDDANEDTDISTFSDANYAFSLLSDGLGGIDEGDYGVRVVRNDGATTFASATIDLGTLSDSTSYTIRVYAEQVVGSEWGVQLSTLEGWSSSFVRAVGTKGYYELQSTTDASGDHNLRIFSDDGSADGDTLDIYRILVIED